MKFNDPNGPNGPNCPNCPNCPQINLMEAHREGC